MEQSNARIQPQDKRKPRFEGGRIYFSRAAERRLFFILTVIMLGIGACFRLGIWQ